MRKTVFAGFAVLAVSMALVVPALPATAAPPEAQHITINFDPANGDAPGIAVATGPISGTGTDVQLSHRSAGKTNHDVDLLTFAAGSVTVKDMSVIVSESFDPSTCTAHEFDKGVFQITSGTGAYAQAKGQGHFTVTVNVSGTPDASAPDGCNFDSPTGSIVVEVDGKVKL